MASRRNERASGDPLRVCNVGYLNSVPYRFLQTLSGFSYDEAEPAEAARRLLERECEAACIPLAEFAASGELRALPFGIAARSAVESVVLVSQQPLSELRNIYLDAASQTSVILLRLILQHSLGEAASAIQYSRMPAVQAAQRLGAGDGALLIGNDALALKDSFPIVLDLAEEWRRITSLPFVFAVWAVRGEAVSPHELEQLGAALSHCPAQRELFARQWADAQSSDRVAAVRYVTESIVYEIGPEEIDGADEFLRRAHAAGLLPAARLEMLPDNASAAGRLRRSVDSILSDCADGERISIGEALQLAVEAPLADIALAADFRRDALHPGNTVSYIVDRNVNYTNVCNVYCRFCAFYRAPGRSGGYVLSFDEIGRKIEETVSAGGIQILLQGGLNPELGIEYYEELFRWIKSNYPINLHALSADEVIHITKVSQLSIEETVQRLILAGLGSLPGGGAEILVDRVRHRIARLKTSSKEWLEVHRVAHRLGITSTCTMMFGVQESWEDRILHLHKLRQLQDETGGFTAFITWPFQDENTKLKRGDTSAPEYLRVQALSRLFLDNIPNIQSSWVTQGPSIGQVALYFGANDFGSVMFEENVVSAAGTTFEMDSEAIESHIRQAGFRPWRRNVHYEQVNG